MMPTMRKFELFSDDYDSLEDPPHHFGSRGIINLNGSVLLMHYASFDHYVFPGGGIEADETAIEALHREILEETGYQITAVQPVLHLKEHFSDSVWHHTFFYAEVTGLQESLHWTQEEKSYGITFKLLNPYEALELLSAHTGNHPYSEAIMNREFLGLSEAIPYFK